LYISKREKCCDEVEIRLAREEDHDDLAEIFNQQVEFLKLFINKLYRAR